MKKRIARAIVFSLLLTGAFAGPPAGATGAPPTDGVGDRFFPQAGNGGYDVARYDLDLQFTPTTGRLDGSARIDARATQQLDQFNIDLRGFDVTAITVNGRPATFTRAGQELTVVPERPVRRGCTMRLAIEYGGVPETVIDPDGALDGWIPTDDGAVVLSEPQGAPSWFPANDHPTDKARFSLAMTVPSDLTVLGNGRPGRETTHDGFTTYRWTQRQPMATYLATVAIGHFDVTTSRSPGGIPIVNGVDPRLAADSQASLDLLGEIVDWEAGLFGRYPFDTVGAIADYAPNVGYALETQTRPVFTSAVDDGTLVHELAHQWFGDSVSVASWPEIWLNEGFATYTEWLWEEQHGGPTAQQRFDEAYASYPADDPFWAKAPGPDALPEAADLFIGPVYTRGAMTLHQLRLAIGDDAFLRLLRRWATQHRYGNVSTAEFVALAQRVSGQDLTTLFTTWLSTPARPELAG